MAVQEARLAVANADLAMAQAQLDEKEAELAAVQAEYDRAMGEKQVSSILLCFYPFSEMYAAKSWQQKYKKKQKQIKTNLILAI